MCVQSPFGLSHWFVVLVSCTEFKTSAGTSDVASYCDCRHVRDGEESQHQNLDEKDRVHDEHDDHCSASGSGE